MANITYNVYRRYSKTEKPIPVATGLVAPTYEIPNIDYDRDVYLSVGRVVNKLEVYGEEYKYFIPFETPTIEASYTEGVITVSWGDNPIYVDDLYLYTSSEMISDDALPPPTVLGKGVTTTTVNKVLAVDETVYIRLGSVRNNKIKLSNEVSASVFEAPYDVVAEFKDDAVNLSWKLDGFVDEQRYYYSETPIDINNLPEPKAVLAGDARTHIDTAVEVGKTYYVRIGSVKNGVEKISSEVSVIADAYSAYVISLLHFDDNLIDEKEIFTYTPIGSISYSSNAKFGKSLDLSSRKGLLTTSSAQIQLGDLDYTIECFINAASFTKNIVEPVIFSIGNNNSAGNQEVILGVDSATSKAFYRVYEDGTYIVRDIKSSAALLLNTWSHVAITKSGVSHYIFIDGVLMASYDVSSSYTLASRSVDLIIGGIISTGSNSNWGRFDGLIDEFRFTKGIARYTEDFEPPTIPFSL